MRAGGDQLCRLAARGRAQVNHAPPGKITEQARWQGGGGILNPPGAVLEAVKSCRVTVKITADRPAIDKNAIKTRRPTGGVTRRCDIQRWWHHRQLHGPACAIVPPVMLPVLPDPVRQIVFRNGPRKPVRSVA